MMPPSKRHRDRPDDVRPGIGRVQRKIRGVIELFEVTQHYGVRPVLRGVSLRVERGELIVVLGPNGMGKSTLLGVMGGVLSPQQGKVVIDGRCRRSSVEDELAIRKETVYLPDQPWLPGNRTGREFLLAVGRLYDVEDLRLMGHVEQLLDLFDLSEVADSPLRTYSAGQKKKAALCSALVTEAPVLLLDEPFSGGLDPSGLLALKRIFQRHAQRKELTIVLTSPVPELVEEIATRIIIIHHGEILAFDTLDGLQRMTGCRGSLGDVLERLIYPDTTRKLDDYFRDFAR
jgi:ABC-type multidrug transport system ATPase subunit